MSNNKLAQKFNARSLIIYSLPTIVMMFFNSTYGIVDGLFVSNFIGENALAGCNIAFPILLIAIAISAMMATGSNALIGKYLGEGKDKEAKELLSSIYIIAILFGIMASILIIIFANPLLSVMGANEVLLPYAREYLINWIPMLTFALLEFFTQSFFITAGKPHLGFIASITGGITNIVLDYVFIVEFAMGIKGAAWATGIGIAVVGIFGLVYFSINRKGTLYFIKPRWNLKEIIQCFYNGISEFVGCISGAITTVLFNIIMMYIAGENGVTGMTVIIYVSGVLSSIFFGYIFGVSPIISYKYGAQAHDQLKLINSTSIKVISIIGVLAMILSIIFAKIAVGIFVSEQSPTFEITVVGFRIYSIAYLFMGFNIFISAMFTSLSNGTISAIISVSRTLVFIVVALLTLPFIFGINGVWFAIPIAELLGLIVSITFFKKYKAKYNY
ncbi:MAG: hypothetical protein ATN31_05045 [Candidatus Epulonipiscioides saccharophilum]|nr:MAG: hypothetical protein ATN31_05045 [Epulopiscium sp. AS2M-Bin001]